MPPYRTYSKASVVTADSRIPKTAFGAHRKSAVFLTAITLCSFLAACGSHDQVVYIYNWSNYIGPDTVPAFEAATGIRVVYNTFDSEEMLETILLAGNSGYDVVSASGDIIGLFFHNYPSFTGQTRNAVFSYLAGRNAMARN